MVTFPAESDGFEQDEPIPFQREQHLSLQPALDNSPLAKRAKIQAIDDIADVKNLIERQGPVTILDEYVSKRALALAREEVKNSYSPDNPPDPDEYKQRVERYQRAYLSQFEEERQAIAKDLRSFPDAIAAQLAQKARLDRKKYVFPSSGRGPFHQRDLAVVSALHKLNLCQDLEEHLEKVHVYVDIYEEAFRNPNEEVVWPDSASFRP